MPVACHGRAVAVSRRLGSSSNTFPATLDARHVTSTGCVGIRGRPASSSSFLMVIRSYAAEDVLLPLKAVRRFSARGGPRLARGGRCDLRAQHHDTNSHRCFGPTRVTKMLRSEEHTSELQSLRHL